MTDFYCIIVYPPDGMPLVHTRRGKSLTTGQPVQIAPVFMSKKDAIAEADALTNAHATKVTFPKISVTPQVEFADE